MNVAPYDKLEPGVREENVFVSGLETSIQLSIAISLKRIADGVQRVPETDEVYRERIAGTKARLGIMPGHDTLEIERGARLDGIGEMYGCRRRYV